MDCRGHGRGGTVRHGAATNPTLLDSNPFQRQKLRAAAAAGRRRQHQQQQRQRQRSAITLTTGLTAALGKNTPGRCIFFSDHNLVFLELPLTAKKLPLSITKYDLSTSKKLRIVLSPSLN